MTKYFLKYIYKNKQRSYNFFCVSKILSLFDFCRYGLREPDRGNLDDPAILWREGKPDYTIANYTFLKEKSQNHTQGILNYRNTPKIFKDDI